MLLPFSLPCGTQLNKLGCGTWNMGDSRAQYDAEIMSLRYGIEHGLNVVDTAEMYGQGRSERLVGKAIEGRRDKVFLTSKFTPDHAPPKDVKRSCYASLERLNTDYLDLYLLHWRSSVPFQQTLAALQDLQQEGVIRYWGVSNLDLEEMENVTAINGGQACLTDQVLFNLENRQAQYSLFPYLRQHHIIATAYSPLGQGGKLLEANILKEIGQNHILSSGHNAHPAQIALAWVLAQPNVLAIPKAGEIRHMQSNIEAQEIQLTQDDLKRIDQVFAPPHKREAINII